ncbi:hypothetical protein BHE74_00016553 [Ensete ventricosum]|nr:hypothetical protein BHE74_00016553 [Ensete ventricosum]RZR95624.1 hypothetical protein BHM03_00024477 [Ensete ventricosum]
MGRQSSALESDAMGVWKSTGESVRRDFNYVGAKVFPRLLSTMLRMTTKRDRTPRQELVTIAFPSKCRHGLRRLALDSSGLQMGPVGRQDSISL